MGAEWLLRRSLEAAGLSQSARQQHAGTSRLALSAYEHGRKSHALNTAARIVGEAGFRPGTDTEDRFS